MPRSYPDLIADDAGFFSAFIVCNDRANTIWLEGVIDLASEQSLAGIVLMLRRDPKGVTVDLSRVTFCDCRLTNFIADLQHHHPTCLRDAPRTAIELLRLVGIQIPPQPSTTCSRVTREQELDLKALRSAVAAEEVML